MKSLHAIGVVVAGIALTGAMSGCSSGSKETADASASNATTKPADASALAGKTWTLTMVEGGTMPAAPGSRHPSLKFNGAEKRASGYAGVNQFGGTYAAEGGKLSFGPLAMTKMAGPAEAMELEGRFSQALSATTGWRIENGELALLAGERVVARFKAA